ncbi:MAG: catalase, partial [Steroidobacteraceae bacterium]
MSAGVSSILMIAASLIAVSPAAAAAAAPPVQSPSPGEIVNQFQKNEGTFRGYRRNHAKGVCISGYFRSSGRAAQYSVAQVFAPAERTPLIGRLSIPGTSPYAWDDSTP